MSYTVKGQTGKGVFTITEVQDGWGKLKSGAGWIYLENPDYCTIQGVAAKPAEPDPADVLAQEIAGKVKGSGLDPEDVLNRVEKILGVAGWCCQQIHDRLREPRHPPGLFCFIRQF